MQGEDREPLAGFWEDLEIELNMAAASGSDIMLGGYINQDIHREETTTCFGQEGIKMTNAVSNLHGNYSHPTHPPGSKTINDIWISKHFTSKAAAIIPLGDM